MRCKGCGTQLYKQWYSTSKDGFVCRRCGAITTADEANEAQVPSATTPGTTLTRRYPGSYREATEVFEQDKQQLGEQHWVAVSQNYVPGQWGTGAWIVAFVLLVFIIGIIVLAYMIAVKPDGELVVTYEYRPPQAAPTPSEPAAVTDPTEQLRKLAELRDAGILTPEEFEAKKAEILARM